MNLEPSIRGGARYCVVIPAYHDAVIFVESLQGSTIPQNLLAGWLATTDAIKLLPIVIFLLSQFGLN